MLLKIENSEERLQIEHFVTDSRKKRKGKKKLKKKSKPKQSEQLISRFIESKASALETLQSVRVRFFPWTLERDIEGKKKVCKQVRLKHDRDRSKLFTGPKRTQSTKHTNNL